MKKLILKTAFLLAGLTSLAVAEVKVTLSEGGAAGEANFTASGEVFASTEQTVDASGAVVDRALGWRWDEETRREIMQSFVTGAEEVSFDKITFKTGGASLGKILQDNANIRFKLTVYRLPTEKALPSAPEAEVVSEQTGDFSGFAAGFATRANNLERSTHAYLSFTFPAVRLEANTHYAVVLAFAQRGQGYAIPLAQNADNVQTYKDGTGGIGEGDGGWINSHDFYFYAESEGNKGGKSN